MNLLAAHLEKSVLPIIGPHPNRLLPALQGSCVLVELRFRHFIVTAKHCLADPSIYVGVRGKKLIEVSFGGFYSINGPADLDIAVIPLQHRQVADLNDLVFIPERFVETDATMYQTGTDNDHVIFGWPGSSSQFRPDRSRRNIKQKSFTFAAAVAVTGSACTSRRFS
jgi:hypothetical protein